jgi:hypothetical protein
MNQIHYGDGDWLSRSLQRNDTIDLSSYSCCLISVCFVFRTFVVAEIWLLASPYLSIRLSAHNNLRTPELFSITFDIV